MASLKILTGSLEGREIDLNPDPNFIGRASQNDIKLVDPGVSSKHAKIWAENDHWWVMDLGSTNGTLVNNADIDREELNDGDKLTFGPVNATFVSGAKRRAPPPAARGRADPEPAPVPGPPAINNAELELEVSMSKARYATLEQDMERLRQEGAEREKFVAEQAVAGTRTEMQKLRDLMRERDGAMRAVEAQIKERESYYSPEEVEREKKRVEASVMLDAKRQAEAYERQVKELEGRVVGRAAEAEALARTVREKDDLIRMLSDREDRAGSNVREKDDKLTEVATELKKVQDELATAVARERESSDKLRQKNVQLADMGKQQAELQQEISKARAVAARVGAGGAGGAAAVQDEALAIAAELDRAKQQLLKARSALNQAQDEIIGANSARDQASARAAANQKTVDELQGQLTDLHDERSRLKSQVDDLLAKHSQMAETERQLAGAGALLEQTKALEAASRDRAQKAETEVTKLKQERLDLVAAKDAAVARLDEINADYRVLRSSRDESFDWEARYKSQQDDFLSLRKENSELKQTVEALQSQVGSAASGTVDDATLAYARSRTNMLEEMAGGMLDGINNAVSLLRRNSEVLKGYVGDCGLLASCVRQINYTLLEPDQQRMLRELIDETQPDVIIRNMEGIGEENAEATHKAKRLILDYLDAMKIDEEGTDLERCFAKSRGLFQAVEPGTEIRVKVSKALPILPTTQPEGVLFAFALLREVKALAVEDEQLPIVRIDPEGDTITMMISPIHPKAKERYRETQAGGGDARSQYIAGFARQGCNGRIDVKDMGTGVTMFITLNAAKPGAKK